MQFTSAYRRMLYALSKCHSGQSRKVERQVDMWEGFAPASARWFARFESNAPVRFTIHLRQGFGATSVMNGGDRREDIFQDGQDRKLWIEAL